MLPHHSDPGNKQIIPFFAKESQWLPYFQLLHLMKVAWPLRGLPPDVTELEIPAACTQPGWEEALDKSLSLTFLRLHGQVIAATSKKK